MKKIAVKVAVVVIFAFITFFSYQAGYSNGHSAQYNDKYREWSDDMWAVAYQLGYSHGYDQSNKNTIKAFGIDNVSYVNVTSDGRICVMTAEGKVLILNDSVSYAEKQKATN